MVLLIFTGINRTQLKLPNFPACWKCWFAISEKMESTKNIATHRNRDRSPYFFLQVPYQLIHLSTYSLVPQYYVKSFRTPWSLYTVFWLRKDAQLAFKRCPFEALLTPFWSPTKHLLQRTLVNIWFYVSYKPDFFGYFELFSQVSTFKLCNNFSNY